MTLSDSETRLLRYALEHLAGSLDADLAVEVGQEVAPHLQDSARPLPDVAALVERLRAKLAASLRDNPVPAAA
jgi:hypothetical protein